VHVLHDILTIRIYTLRITQKLRYGIQNGMCVFLRLFNEVFQFRILNFKNKINIIWFPVC